MLLLRLAGLTSLAADHFALVPDAFALVGFGRPHAADTGSFFADRLLVDTQNRNLGLAIDRIGNAIWRVNTDRVGIADVEHQVLAVHRSAVADSLNLQVLAEPVRNADHHVADQRA